MVYHGVILVDVLYKYRFRPLGAYRIANVLREQGYNILVIDMYSSLAIDELKDLLSKVITEETLFLGYSSTLFTAYLNPEDVGINHEYEPGLPTLRGYFIETNRFVKEKYPNIKVIYGGASTPQMLPLIENSDENFYVDIMVLGYAESMIPSVVHNIKHNLPQQVSRVVKNIEIIEYDFTAKQYDFRNHLHVWDPSDNISPDEVLPLEVARGCVFKCKFCSFPLIGKHKNDLSYVRTEDQLTREIQENYEKYNTTHYSIVDDTFNEKTSKIETMLRVRDKTKIDLKFNAYIRLDLVVAFPEQFELLKDLNVCGQYYGIETLTEQSAKAVSKGGNPDKLVEAIYKMNDVFNDKVNLEAGQIIGLPYETRETVEISVQKLMDTPIDSVLFFPLGFTSSAYGQSELTANPEKYGYTIIDHQYMIWKNQYWDFYECAELAGHYTKKYHESGRLRVGSMIATNMINLGYDYFDIYKMPTSQLYSPEMITETKQRNLDRRNQYFAMLDDYLTKN